MYNRYIPEDASYTPVQAEPQPSGTTPAEAQPRRSAFRLPDFLSGERPLLGGKSGETGLSGLLKSLHLDRVDSGDVLLLLILLYLLAEGDDLDLVIALGLVLLMGLGEEEERPPG